MHSPEASRKKGEERHSDTETDGDRKRRHRRRKHRDKEGTRDSPQLMNDKYERPPSGAPRDDDSDGTVDLPDRFDERGNRTQESGDPLEQLIGNLASRFMGGSEERGSDRDSRSGRRRHRQ